MNPPLFNFHRVNAQPALGLFFLWCPCLFEYCNFPTTGGKINAELANDLNLFPGNGPFISHPQAVETYYYTGDEITLGDGFQTEPGADFTAQISDLSAAMTEVTYGYNQLGQMVSVGVPGDPDFYAAYSYNTDGSLAAESLNNGGLPRNFSYNSPGWLTAIDGTLFDENIDYTGNGYNGAGYYSGKIARTTFTGSAQSGAGYAVQYQYNNLGWLEVADYSLYNGADLGVGIGNEIKYDANGNFLSVQEGASAKIYTYKEGTNQTLNTDGAGDDYLYDQNGNITAALANQTALTNIRYDAFSNLTDHMEDGTLSVDFEYGGANQRILKKYAVGLNAVETLYLHGSSDYPLLEKKRLNLDTETTNVYIYGSGGLLAMHSGLDLFFVIKDHLGSTRVVAGEDNTVVASHDYAPFGNTIASSGASGLTYRYTGQEYDDEVGLHNYRARFYDSDLGRFYGMDPAGQFFSPYSYAGNSPVIFIDPDGELVWFVPILIGAAIGATTGAIIAEQNGQDWWKGAVVGGVLGGLGGSLISSAVGATGIGGSVAGVTTTALNNAAFQIGMSTVNGGEAWKAGLVGLGTGVFSATGGFELAKQGLLGRLGFQGMSSTLSSVGQNFSQGKGLFSKVVIGLGPINFTVGKDQKLLNWRENIGNIAFNGVGMLGVLTGGDIYFDKENLAFGYNGGLLNKLYDNSWTGAYAILGDSRPTNRFLNHELTHIWQSRSFGNSFLPVWLMQGLRSKLAGKAFAHGINYIEQQGYANQKTNFWGF